MTDADFEKNLELVKRHQEDNTKKVVELLATDTDLRHLDKVLDKETADIYRRVLPRHAELCELDQRRGLNKIEKAELAVTYGSLYPTFGDSGVVEVAAAWLATRPQRQARGS